MSWVPDQLDAHSDQVREVYAHFGLAVYAVQVLEHGLVNFVLVARTIGSVFATLHERDTFEAELFGSTMGRQLRHALAEAPITDADARERPSRAADRAHAGLLSPIVERGLVPMVPRPGEAGLRPVVSNGGAMRTLFTIGYENHRTPDSLIAALRDAGVRRLVDVRELPLSRKRGFSKTSLSEALDEANIEYEHVRALGNPKPYRDLYKAGRVAEGERRYRKHLHNGSYGALIELGETLDETTCLLCFEASHEDCHRSVIVEALEERLGTIDVVHLQ